ncbi:site-specific DNA-methyltransferase [Clostridium butyricum]|uniref:site-specific DNA-methyltransferase n=1 Tax=Clostridium butyricum TaxID=1492 RepID=UPI0002C8FDB8|nr:site-specific DNA-methyltransferase [Clostridium butyricum]EMU52147.1 hypothetical protein CBDKU1_39290 [Clostridium butyricum DKU-01]
MENRGKLELTWVDKYNRKKIEPRILIEDKEKSYGDINSRNILIHGDNLLALKSLQNDYSGKIKCIYIDPPYNTGNAFEYYDDELEHSIWLNMMRDRLELLKDLLTEDGFICVHIDNSEGEYLKVLLDEIFGRKNYKVTFYIQVRYPEKTLKQDMDYHKLIEQVHVYSKSEKSKPNLPKAEYSYDKFEWYIETKEPFKEIVLGGKKVEIYNEKNYKIKKGNGSINGLKEIWASGSILDGNSSGRFFRDYLSGRQEEDGLKILYKVYGIGDDMNDYRYFTGPKKETATRGKYYQGVPVDNIESEKNQKNLPISNYIDLASYFGNCRHEGGVEFKSGKKPEILIKMFLELFSNKGDYVLDSFAGSGTTAAVAHKMERNWITIELGEHCYTHTSKRLINVINGDKTGISDVVNWNGGGGFKFYELGESLMVKDEKLGTYIINPKYSPEMICRAICKIEEFTFLPRGHFHGYSSEKRFIHITTNFLNQKYIEMLRNELSEEESLLVYCTRMQSSIVLPNNIEVKRIPKDLLQKCDFESEE